MSLQKPNRTFSFMTHETECVGWEFVWEVCIASLFQTRKNDERIGYQNVFGVYGYFLEFEVACIPFGNL